MEAIEPVWAAEGESITSSLWVVSDAGRVVVLAVEANTFELALWEVTPGMSVAVADPVIPSIPGIPMAADGDEIKRESRGTELGTSGMNE